MLGSPFRPYQLPVFEDRHSKIALIHWGRRLGKSYTLSAWAVDRCLTALCCGRDWLVTVLSNSKENGREFALKACEWARKVDDAAQEVELTGMDAEDFAYEVRFRLNGCLARIKILAANPRTARGFGGDLILDEFAFHEDADAIWSAVEPIISSDLDFLCRIASTGNGKANTFYRMVSRKDFPFPLSSMTRSEAWRNGWIKVQSTVTGKECTPAEARAEALDKGAYDQNYENSFAGEGAPWLTVQQVTEVEADAPWYVEADLAATYDRDLLELLASEGLYGGWDFARSGHQSCLALGRKRAGRVELRAMLLMRGYSSTAQARLVAGLRLRNLVMDATGNGIGPYDNLVDSHSTRVTGLVFSCTEPASPALKAMGYAVPTASIPVMLACHLASTVVGKAIVLPANSLLRDDLTGPQKVVAANGRISVHAPELSDGSHCDRFFAAAMMLRAMENTASGALTEPGAVLLGSPKAQFVARRLPPLQMHNA